MSNRDYILMHLYYMRGYVIYLLFDCIYLNSLFFSSAIVFFFFKQKTAYEMLRSLVGSEMCIRDSPNPKPSLNPNPNPNPDPNSNPNPNPIQNPKPKPKTPNPDPRGTAANGAQTLSLESVARSKCAERFVCLLYTSDAADEEDSVDLGGRRLIKKKNMKMVCGEGGQ
eukprot:TRINITY_DN26209_c0_g1_i1.p1 TRINITY_DN26209_c0_g1~~TRINITY_DN26209_c0_g1_i1.p1  ORF type:complete len:168 (+),score=33.80 TRINITY_DN26209_c0_g1_i1:13-516(+)